MVKSTSRSANSSSRQAEKPFVGVCAGKPGLRSISRASGGLVTVRAVVLVGFMGAGKTAVGRELARQLGWPFEDLDDRIQKQESRSVEQIFRESGESEFRRAEHAALKRMIEELPSGPRVVALGGGAFVQANNLAVLESAKLHTVFLNAPHEELFRRCEEQQGALRPLRRDQTQFAKLYTERQPQYKRARFKIETTNKDIATVAGEISSLLGILP